MLFLVQEFKNFELFYCFKFCFNGLLMSTRSWQKNLQESLNYLQTFADNFLAEVTYIFARVKILNPSQASSQLRFLTLWTELLFWHFHCKLNQKCAGICWAGGRSQRGGNLWLAPSKWLTCGVGIQCGIKRNGVWRKNNWIKIKQ